MTVALEKDRTYRKMLSVRLTAVRRHVSRGQRLVTGRLMCSRMDFNADGAVLLMSEHSQAVERGSGGVSSQFQKRRACLADLNECCTF